MAMAGVWKPSEYIDLTGGNLSDEVDSSLRSGIDSVARATQELASTWQARDQPALERTTSKSDVRHPLVRGGRKAPGLPYDTSYNTDIMAELNSKWHARPTRETLPHQRRINSNVFSSPPSLTPTTTSPHHQKIPERLHLLPAILKQGQPPSKTSSIRTNTYDALNPPKKSHGSESKLGVTGTPQYQHQIDRPLKRTANGDFKRAHMLLTEPIDSIPPPSDGLPGKTMPKARTTSTASQAASHSTVTTSIGERKATLPCAKSLQLSGPFSTVDKAPPTPQTLSPPLSQLSGINGHRQQREGVTQSDINAVRQRFAKSYNDNSLSKKAFSPSTREGPSLTDQRRPEENDKPKYYQPIRAQQCNMPKLPSSYVTPSCSTSKVLVLPSITTADPVFKVSTPVEKSPSNRLAGLSVSTSKLLDDAIQASQENGVSLTALEIPHLESLVVAAQRPLTTGQPFIAEEDELIIFLKERTPMRWPQIHDYFPGRASWPCLATRYSSRLQPRLRNPRELQAPNNPSTQLTVARNGINHIYGNEPLFEIDGCHKVIHESRKTSAPAVPIGHSDTALSQSVNEFHLSRVLPRGQQIRRFKPNNEVYGNSTDGIVSYTEERRNTRVQNVSLSSRVQLYDENRRDAAALGSQTLRISRQPLPEQSLSSFSNQAGPLRLIGRKRRSIDMRRPYLNALERKYLITSTASDMWNSVESVSWEGQILHVDFLEEEIEALALSIQAVRPTLNRGNKPVRSWSGEAMRHATEEQIDKISRHAQHRGVFLNRTKNSLNAFLRDLAGTTLNVIPSFQKLAICQRDTANTHFSRLRERELGNRTRGRDVIDLQAAAQDTLGPHLSSVVGSGDVTNVAWSPNGEIFAAGCVALTDEHSMQYNERNNLILGDITTKKLRELPEHSQARPLTSAGANSSRDMHNSQESLLFASVSAVQFSPDGGAMFSAGYDKVARVWDMRKDRKCTNSIDNVACVLEFRHHASIDLLAVNIGGLFATGSQRNTSGIKILKYDFDAPNPRTLKKHSLSSPRARDRPNSDIVPSCMRWGYNIYQQQKYLLCGFSSRAKDFGDGEICIWDVEVEQPQVMTRGSSNVFDVAWSPSTYGRFAVGSTPSGKKVNRGTNSVVRIYDTLRVDASLNVNSLHTVELECPALDMNDIVFNPLDDFLVSAGCTNGVTYVWDLRNPDELLHQLSHGLSVIPLDETRPREETDTGIRFLSWGQSRRQIYTGSSDGVVALWNPYLSPSDTHMRDVIQLNSGIMSGAFSPDFSNLLLGEVNGTISLLSVGNDDKTTKDFEPFSMIHAEEKTLAQIRHRVGAHPGIAPENQSTIGTIAARTMLQNHELEIRDFGDMPLRQAVQGPRYAGPFDKAPDAPAMRMKAEEFQARFRPSKDPCDIRHDIPKLTEEESGDTGAWQARIPERLRWGNSLGIAGLRDIEYSAREWEGLICFRCHTAPLEASVPKDHQATADVVVCTSCKLAWRVEVLGYTPVDFFTHEHLQLHDWETEDLHEEDGEIELGDMATYCHSFWKDRSPSPL